MLGLRGSVIERGVQKGETDHVDGYTEHYGVLSEDVEGVCAVGA